MLLYQKTADIGKKCFHFYMELSQDELQEKDHQQSDIIMKCRR